LFDIQKNQEISLENVLSVRKKMNQEELQKEIVQMSKIIEKYQAVKVGPLVTSTFSAEIVNEDYLMDMEIMIPLNKPIPSDQTYKQKKIFHLVNALSCRFMGNPVGVQSTYESIINYITDKGLQQITAFYNVYISDNSDASLEEMIIDIYVGVNPSIL
jgi:effector-binding domain-containing protein